jgi:exostosin family protein
MARVFLFSVTPEDDQTDYNLAPLLDLRKSVELDRFRLHTVTDDPDAADLIIFAEFYGAGWYFERLRRHSLLRKHRDKCFLFCANPYVIPFLPGVYTGVEERWSSSRTRPGFYLGRTRNEFTVAFDPPAHDLPYLFSFMGSVRNAPIRRKLVTLRHDRSFFQDTGEEFDRLLNRKMEQRERLDYERRYAELTKASKFVLCPRGQSVSSVRLFETMRMGRVPVILSDGWVAPAGPRWERFALRIREREFAKIPRLLEQREAEAVEMGELARKEWQEWFSDEVLFHRLVELCLDIKQKRRLPENMARWPVYLQYLRPFHLRRMLGTKYRALRQTLLRS